MPTAERVGGGPSGLMAAEMLLNQGLSVDLYEAKPSVGRKFLMAGKSGLNLTHAESFDNFLKRFEKDQLKKNLLIKSPFQKKIIHSKNA